MPYIIIIEKQGTLKETNIKEFIESDLYKKANFKSAEGFHLQTVWDVFVDKKPYKIGLFGKIKGKAGQENKYECPPPIDSTLFFGACVLVNIQTSNPALSITDLRISEWVNIYDVLMGGFEDIQDSENDDEFDEDQEEIENACRIGRDGYVRDDFVIEDDDIDYDNISEEELEEIDESPEDEDEIKLVVPISKKNKKAKPIESKKINKKVKPVDVIEVSNDEYLDCQSELEEEAFL
jgi:hypothetical protein